MIKGTGIASSFNNVYKKFGNKKSKKARKYFYKSTRVYQVYKLFPKPIAQMYRDENITPNKFLKFGGKDWTNKEFEKFVNEIEVELTNNIGKYESAEGNTNEYRNDLQVSDDVLQNVKKFTLNLSLSINEM